MKFSAPRGTKDILPEEAAKWHWLESTFREQCRLYGFGEIRTPIFEETELFLRSIGEETEVVNKQMYTFTDRGDRSLTLRPEGTAGVVRAYLQNGLAEQGGVQRLFYIGPFFRYERPQAGRFRQFHQAGIELFGSDDSQADVEVISLAVYFLESLGLEGAKLRINSMGCKECRAAYREALRKALAPVVDKLCDWCKERYAGNTLRILDEKRPECRQYFKDLPSIQDYLDENCKAHFAKVLAGLDLLKIQYEVDPGIVRGLDYYTRTVFEFNQPGIGAQDALGGGGRYDGLVEEFGGKPTPAVGFGLGLERVLAAVGEKAPLPAHEKALVYVAFAVEARAKLATTLLAELRAASIAAISDLLGRSLKAQMKEAARLNCRFVILIGEDELAADSVTLRDMVSGEQQCVKRGEVVAKLKQLLEQEQS